MAEPKQTRPSRVSKVKATGLKQANGFIEFVREQGIVGLAIGFIIGAAAATLMRSLVDNVFMPPIGILLGSADGLKGLEVSLGMHNGKEAIMHYGLFLNDLVNFLILALAIYLVIRVLRLDKLDKKKA